jgi:CheY-like chemotaxis protein
MTAPVDPAAIYILDDDHYYLALYKRILITGGYVVETASAASQVDWEKLLAADLLMLDMIMPTMDGLEFLQQIAERNFRKNIVLVTSLKLHETGEVQEKLADLGLNITRIIHKPFLAEQLLDAAKSALPGNAKLTYTKRSIEYLKTCILEERFIIHYKPYFRLSDHGLAHVQIEPYLAGNEAVLPEDYYSPILENTRYFMPYLKVLIEKVLMKASFVKQFRQCRLVLRLPVALLNQKQALLEILALLSATVTRKTKIMISVEGNEFFLARQQSLAALAQMKAAGYPLMLDNANLFLKDKTASSLSIFDEIRLDASELFAASPQGKAPLLPPEILRRLTAEGVTICIKNAGKELQESALLDYGFSHTDRVDTSRKAALTLVETHAQR